jgi:hypothetical protein
VTVGDAIRKRMRELKMSTAQLARETGLSETTIRYIGDPSSKHNRASLVAISAVLRWRYDYLLNILRGEPEKNVIIRRPIEASLERLLHAELGSAKEEIEVTLERLLRAEVGSVIEEVAGLRDLVERINEKISVLAENRRPGADDAGHE